MKQMALFVGEQFARCRVCGRRLKTSKAIAKGIGSGCERKQRKGNHASGI